MQLDFDRPEAKTFRRDETRVSSRREKTEEKKNADAYANAATTRTDGSDTDGSDSKASAGSFVMVPDPRLESHTSRVSIPEPDRETGMVFVRAAVDVDCVQRVYVASRSAEASTAGAFTNVSPP